MNTRPTIRYSVDRWSPASRRFAAGVVLVIALLLLAPLFVDYGLLDRLTALFVYIILAAMWNALAGYAGLVSIGQQLFFGLGAYLTIRVANFGVDPFVAILVAACGVGLISIPVSFLMLRFRGGEFAIGMWVLAALTHLLVNLDPLIQGETGISLISLNAYEIGTRTTLIYLLALVSTSAMLIVLFNVLRSRTGIAIQAIRDNETAAEAVGVSVTPITRILFMLAAIGAGLAGAIWLASATSFQPKTYFGVQWTAYMIFMVLIGGIGRFEGAILGAVIFFLLETWFGSWGVWYLIGLGSVAVFVSLFFPKGIWGYVESRFELQLLPVGYRLTETFGEESGSTAKPALQNQ